MIPLSVQGHTISAQNLEPLISGEVNSHLLRFTFSSEWEGLLKTAVFTNGETTVDVPAASWEDGGCAIPYEVLEKPWLFVSVGVEGRRGTQLVLRTTPLRLGHVSPSLSPCGHGAQELTPPVWQVILDCIGDPESLQTENREDLVSAINELAASGGGAPEVQLGGDAPGSGIKLWVDESAQWPQPDWTQDDSSEPDFIKNKPTLFSGSYNDLTGKPTLFSGSYDDLSDKPAIPAAQIQSDWNQSDASALDYIKNKPQIGGAGALALIASVTTTEEVEEIEISGFDLTEIVVVMRLKGASTNGTGTTAAASKGVQFYFNGQNTAVQSPTMDNVLPPSGYTGSVESYISVKKLAYGYLANYANSYGINTSVQNGIVQFSGAEKNAFPAGIGYANFAQLNLVPKETGWKFGTGSIVAIYGR